MKSIKTKIVVSMILMVALSVLALGGATIYLNYNNTNQLLEQTMAETASIAAERVSNEILSYINISQEVGYLAQLSDPAVPLAEKQAILDQRVENHNLTRGNIIGADGKSIFDGKDYTEREYFKQGMAGIPWVSEPLVSKVTGELTVIVAAPLWSGGIAGGTVAGVVYFVPHENFLNDIAASIQVSENGSAYMLDKNGNTIAHKNADNVKNQENTIADAKTDAGLGVLAGLEQRMINGEEGFGQYSYGGVDKFLAFAPVTGTNGWSIGINAPTSDFMSSTIFSIIVTIAMLIVSILVAVLLAFRLGNGIGRPIKACADRLVLLAQGDLKTSVPAIRSKDETSILASATATIVHTIDGIMTDVSFGLDAMGNGDFTVDSNAKELYVGDFQPLATSMYKIMNQLTDVLLNINESAHQVSSGSEQVSSGSQALAQGATEQAASIQELAATVGEIAEQVKENATNALQANEIGQTVNNEMQDSNRKMGQMTGAMNEIGRSSGDIGKIIKTIEDIAFQTNILALNAAVEAARAGAAGKGFAVVADEVRNLASKSAEASKNTSALIENSIHAVSNGTKIADETAASLAAVVEGSKQIIAMLDKISQASEEQAASIEQVTLGVSQISNVVQANSATSEESAAASEELSSQAQILKDLVARFKLKKMQ